MPICSKLGLSCIAPRQKINVMIVGNHSAGKSSYINWYVGEHVQSTAVAIETQGFTFCTSGKKRDTLKGQATMVLFQHLQEELNQFAPAIYNGWPPRCALGRVRTGRLTCAARSPRSSLYRCTSREALRHDHLHRHAGLVDGSFQYPFPVEDAIVAVAKHVDLIYVFFDPIGQARRAAWHDPHLHPRLTHAHL